MSQTVEVEVDDVHSFMIDQMTDDEMSVEEFVQEMSDTTIYNAYQRWKAQQDQQDGDLVAEEDAGVPVE